MTTNATIDESGNFSLMPSKEINAPVSEESSLEVSELRAIGTIATALRRVELLGLHAQFQIESKKLKPHSHALSSSQFQRVISSKITQSFHA
jgi:hypothetical protein